MAMDMVMDMRMGRKANHSLRPVPQRCRQPRLIRASLLFVAMFQCFGMAHAQDESSPKLFELGVLSSLSYTDNVGAASVNVNDDWVLNVTPWLRTRKEYGRLTGSMDARLRTLTFADETDRNTAFVILNGRGVFEAVNNVLFIDGEARIGRENRSAFVGRNELGLLDADDENEIRTFRLGPRLEFRPFGETDALLAYHHRWLNGGGEIVGREIGVVDAKLENPHAYGPWGWNAEYRREHTQYDLAEIEDVIREDARIRGQYAITPRLVVAVLGGWERNDFGFGDKRDDTIYGAGFGWRPSPRTEFIGVVEERFFGTGYNLDLTHRRARTRWQFTALRQVASAADEYTGVESDALFQRFYDDLSGISDPVAREEEARRRTDQALAQSIGPFSTNHYFLSQELGFGFSWSGRRTVLAVNARQGHRTRLGQVFTQDGRDDLSTYRRVNTRSLAVSLNRRVTPQTTAQLTASYRDSEGLGDDQTESERYLLGVGVSTRFGPNTTGGLSYQHDRLEGRGAARDYRENTVTANLGVRF